MNLHKGYYDCDIFKCKKQTKYMYQSHLLLFTESHVSSQCFILMEEYVYLYNSIQSHDCHIQQYSHMTLPYTTLYSHMTLPYTTV